MVALTCSVALIAQVPKLNAAEWAAGTSMARAMRLKEDAQQKKDAGEAHLLEDAVAAWASAVPGGEIEAAKIWTKAVAEALQKSVEGEQTLLRVITTVSLSELRAIQGELSCPPPGGKKILLRDLVTNGVGGVAKQNMLRKLELAVVYDSDGCAIACRTLQALCAPLHGTPMLSSWLPVAPMLSGSLPRYAGPSS